MNGKRPGPWLGLLKAGLLCSTVLALSTSAEESPDPAAMARSYVEALLGAETPDLDEFHDAKMKSAMTPARVQQARSGLRSQLGDVREIAEPWHEDRVGELDRWRVPVDFERGELDARVVIDTDSKVAGIFFVPRVQRPSENEPEAPGAERDVEIGDGEHSLPGSLLIPKGDGPFPGVVLVHGSGAQDRDETIGPNKPLRDLAWGLAERGIASLRYDKRSFARPGSLSSLGDDLTVEHEVVRDAREALRTLAEVSEIDKSRLYLVGHSLGGTVLPRIPSDEVPVAGMVVLAGMTLPLHEKVVEQTEYALSLQPEVPEQARQQADQLAKQMHSVEMALRGEAEPPSGYLMGAPFAYYADLEAHPPAKLAKAAQRPILVLQGERDYQVTMGDFAVWQEALQGESFACLRSYPALDHLFHPGEGPSKPSDYQVRKTVASEVIADIADWIQDSTCRKAKTP